MDYFENLVKTLLEKEYFWVRQSVKVNLTKDEKRKIGKPTTPRPEIDLLVLDYNSNKIIAVEVKSYLDSTGVSYDLLNEEHEIPEGRYKLFSCKNYRETVFNRLRNQLLESGFIKKETEIILGLIAGNVQRNDGEKIENKFKTNGWLFWGPQEVKKRVKELAEMKYENNPYIITAKMLLRNYT